MQSITNIKIFILKTIKHYSKNIFFLLKKPYYICNYIEDYITFYPNNRVKLCCMTFSMIDDVCNISEINNNIQIFFELVLNKKREMRSNLREGKIYEICKTCRCLHKGYWKHKKPQEIKGIVLNHYTGCNLNCIYCDWSKSKWVNTNTNLVIDVIKHLHRNKYLSSSPYISIGGGHGEPSLNSDLDELIKYCVANNIRLHINSNAVKYKELYSQAVNSGILLLTLTIDAGTREIYKIVKGADYFALSWHNVKLYMLNTTNNVHVKFLLHPENIGDIENMVDCCVRNNVREIVIDRDLNIKGEIKTYITLVNNFYRLCRNHGIIAHKGVFLPLELWKAAQKASSAEFVHKYINK